MGSPRGVVFFGLAGTLVLASLVLSMAAARPAPAGWAPVPSPSTSASPNPTSSPGQSSGLPSLLPSFDPQKAIVQTLAEMLYGVDQELLLTMQNIWNPMVAGTDNIDGRENLGFIVDNSKLRNIWALTLAVAPGSVFVLLFAVMAVHRILGELAGG